MRLRRFRFRMVLIASAFFAASLSNVSAQDHLVPELGSINDPRLDYFKLLRDALLSESGVFDHYRARVFVIPAFKPAWVVTLASNDGDEPTYSIQCAEFKSGQPLAKINDAVVQKANCSLDRKTGEVLEKVWLQMLRDVRYSERAELRADGTTYHFSRFVPLGALRAPAGMENGATWSPAPKSLTGKLAALGEEMRNLALAPGEKREKLAAAIYENATALERELAGQRDPNKNQQESRTRQGQSKGAERISEGHTQLEL